MLTSEDALKISKEAQERIKNEQENIIRNIIDYIRKFINNLDIMTVIEYEIATTASHGGEFIIINKIIDNSEWIGTIRTYMSLTTAQEAAIDKEFFNILDADLPKKVNNMIRKEILKEIENMFSELGYHVYSVNENTYLEWKENPDYY